MNDTTKLPTHIETLIQRTIAELPEDCPLADIEDTVFVSLACASEFDRWSDAITDRIAALA